MALNGSYGLSGDDLQAWCRQRDRDRYASQGEVRQITRRYKMRSLHHLVFVMLTMMSLTAIAEIGVPPRASWVTDLTGTLNAEEVAALEARLTDFTAAKGTQVAVLLVPSTEGELIESFALRVAEVWTLGRTGIDDGALLVVAVKDRQLRIEVGYGLEGALTDATSNRIIDEWIVPPFKTGDIHTGVIAGVEQILRVIEGEALPSPRPTPSQYWDAVWIAFCMAFLFVALLSGRGRPHPLRVSLAAVASGAMTFVLTTFALTAGISAFAAVVIASWLGGSTGRRRRVSPRRDHDSFSGDRIEGRDGGGDGDGDEGGSFGGGGASGRW